MADDKKKLDFGKLSKRKKTTPETRTPKKVYQEVVAQPPASEKTQPKAPLIKKEKKKVGRKSWKQPDVRYTRVAFDTPISTRQKLKQLLVGKFYETYISQDEMINVAINDFIKKHSK